MQQALINQYLNTLYYTSQDNFSAGASTDRIAKLIGISNAESANIIHYLSSKQWVDVSRSFREEIVLTAKGIDAVLKLRTGKVFKRFRFLEVRYFPPATKMVFSFRYWYEVIDEKGTSQKSILVEISDVLSMVWQFNFQQRMAEAEMILLQAARDVISEKLKEGVLKDEEELILLTSNQPQSCPYGLERLIAPKLAEYEVEAGTKMLITEIKENQVAAAIIELRDNINAVFSHKHKENLLLLNQERNLLDFFKTATTAEEFSVRVLSLAQVSRYLNNEVLRKHTLITDTNVQSVSLLDSLLVSLGKPDQPLITTLRNIGRLRQGYPTHEDVSVVIKAYRHFGLSYPVQQYQESWLLLCNQYLIALQQLFEILSNAYL